MIDDVINASWAFQDLIQRGRKEGIEEGLQAQKQNLILLIQKHYPALLQLTQDVCNAIQTLEESQDLFKKIINAEDERQVRRILLDARK